MAQQWEYIGQKPNGQWKLTISTEGQQPDVYYGKTKADIADQLAVGKDNANKAILELKRGQQPTPQTPRPTPKNVPVPLKPEERMQAVSDLTNPAKIDAAVTRIVESVVGPVAELRETIARGPENRQHEWQRNAVTAAAKFADDTPDWHPSEFNRTTLANYMRAQGMDMTKVENYTTAFQKLSAAGLLQKQPEGQDPDAQERTAPQPAQPTRTSTGVRPSDMGGVTTMPGRRLKYSAEQIAKMGAKRYKELMLSDPEFVRAVEHYARPQRRAS